MNFKVAKCNDFIIDGKISSAEWNKAEVYNLSKIVESNILLGEELNEKGNVRMMHSDKYWYVALDMEDSDVVNQGTKDQQHHYTMGDTIEVFIKPLNDTYYYEMYGTPQGFRTNFFYPSRSYVFLPQSDAFLPEFEVKTFVDGTLNDWQKEDKGWKIEFKFPIHIFEQYGAKFAPGNSWQFLIARQNYSRKLPMKELSTLPQVKIADFHMISQYGLLDIE